MPKITIKEHTRTENAPREYANFSVVVPGFCGKADVTVLDDNGIYEVSSPEDFKNNIGLRVPEAIWQDAAGNPVYQYGNQIAYELLNLGYTVLFKDLHGCIDADGKKFIQYPEDTLEEYKHWLINSYLGTAYEEDDIRPDNYASLDTDAKAAFDTAYNNYKEAHAQLVTDISSAGTVASITAFMVAERKHAAEQALEDAGAKITVSESDTDTYATFAEYVDADWWGCLKDKSTYDFRYILSGVLADNEQLNKDMALLAGEVNGRGDCVALLDVDENVYINSTNQSSAAKAILQEAEKQKTSYATWFAPSVIYKNTPDADHVVSGTEDIKLSGKLFPASFHYLACAAKAFSRYSEWYAVAGYTRGISDITIDKPRYIFGEVAMNACQQRDNNGGANVAVNLITKIKNGYYIWGNRTAQTLLSDGLQADHFLNIRQLQSTIKKQLYVSCRALTFDPNSVILWLNFCNRITPTLERMKGDQGIKDYKIEKIPNPGRATLGAIIRIIPIEAVEDFVIHITLEDSLDGTVNVSLL